MAISEDTKHKDLMKSMKKLNESLENINSSIKNLTKIFDQLNRVNAFTKDQITRKNHLIIGLLADYGKIYDSEGFDVSELINRLFVVGFTEEEILELGIFTEDDIDKANEDNSSNDI